MQINYKRLATQYLTVCSEQNDPTARRQHTVDGGQFVKHLCFNFTKFSFAISTEIVAD